MAVNSAKSETNCPFPMWSIFITTDDKNPSAYWMQTYRVPYAKGRTLFWVDNKSKIEQLKKVWQEWWSYTHSHWLTSGSWGDWSWDAKSGNTNPASSMPPYITVYMWKRVSKEEADNSKEFYNPFGIEDTNKVFGNNAIVDPSTISNEFPNGKPMEVKAYYVW